MGAKHWTREGVGPGQRDPACAGGKLSAEATEPRKWKRPGVLLSLNQFH